MTKIELKPSQIIISLMESFDASIDRNIGVEISLEEGFNHSNPVDSNTK